MEAKPISRNTDGLEGNTFDDQVNYKTQDSEFEKELFKEELLDRFNGV